MTLRFAHRFAEDTRGAIAVVFGLSFMVLICAAALAWDSSRIYNVRSQVQAALDAAALAGAKSLDPDNYDPALIEQVATAFFNTRATDLSVADVVLTNFDAEPNLADRTVETSVKVKIRTIFGSVTGRGDDLEFTPTAKTKFAMKKLEVALVLDVTGSMGGTRIEDLKVAAKEMIDTLYSSFPQAGAIKVSLVPYSASVNLGSYFIPSVAVTAGATDTCVVEREGINTYTNAAPVSGSLFETTGNTDPSMLAAYMCPSSPIVPLTDLSAVAARDNFKAQIDALSVGGWTSGHLGLAWGWYTISPEWSSVWPADSDPKPYRNDVMKVVVLMTDGDFNTAYWNDGYTYNSLPGNHPQRLDPANPGTSAYQAIQLCDTIKDRVAEPFGPVIYTVSFHGPPSADALMEQCAGIGNAYTADNRGTLTAAFNDIVTRLTNLAVTN